MKTNRENNRSNILDRGSRPKGTLDTSKPPKGGSGVLPPERFRKVSKDVPRLIIPENIKAL